MSRLKPSCSALALLLLAGTSALAQGGAKPPQPRPTQMPYPFFAFSEADALGRVFDGYDPRTGRVAGLPNDEKKPSLVRIKDTWVWHAGGQERLLVLAEIAGSDYDFVDLCGNCAMYTLLAVLKREGHALALVARQDVPASAVPADADTDGGEHLPDDPYAPFLQTGHDTRVWLDPSRYCINEREALVGVRRERKWLPARDYSTDLALYHIEGGRLRKVFDEAVIERDYPRGLGKGRPVLKTYTMISPRPGGGEFYDLVFEKVTFRCLDRKGSGDCDLPGRPRAVRRWHEVWSFDGKSFKRTRKPVPPRPARGKKCAGDDAFPTVARAKARGSQAGAGVTHTQ